MPPCNRSAFVAPCVLGRLPLDLCSAEVGDVTATPSLESAQLAWAAAEEEDAFWRDHYSLLARRHPNQFVAVARATGHVVATDPDLDRLIGIIGDNGLDVQRVWVRYMAVTPIHLAL